MCKADWVMSTSILHIVLFRVLIDHMIPCAMKAAKADLQRLLGAKLYTLTNRAMNS